MTTGELIKKYRKDKKIKQREVAEKIGVTTQSYAQYERGLRNPKPSTLKKIADAIGIPAGYLLGESETNKKLADYSTEELLEEIQRRKNMSNKIAALKDLTPGTVFKSAAGDHIVLGHDVAAGTTKVIRRGLIAEDIRFDRETCNYTESALKERFDVEYTKMYEEAFSDFLVEHEVNLISVDMQQYGTFKCKVRPITFDEAREYNQHIVNKELPDWYWTCTPWSTDERGWRYGVAVVSPSGFICIDDFDNDGGVRPFCILKSNLFVSLT